MPDLATERAVVEMLLDLVPTGVLQRSLRHGDPSAGEPDLMGTTDAGVEIGFEVTEVIDQDLARADPEAAGVETELRQRFRHFTWSASGEHLPQGVTAFVQFEVTEPGGAPRPADRSEKRLLYDAIVTGILDRKRGWNGEFVTEVRAGSTTITATVDVISSPFRSCSFECSEVVPFGIPLLERIEAKLEKSYKAGLPVHLVAFFRLSPYFNMDRWSDEIRRLSRENMRATRFAAIHVIDALKGVLLFSETTEGTGPAAEASA